MYSISAGFAAQLPTSHLVLSRVEVLSAGTVVRTLDTYYAGEVAMSKTALIRRSGKIDVADPDGSLTPLLSGSGPISPYGAEIRLWRGLRWYSGSVATDEYVPIATLRVARTTVRDGPIGKTIGVVGYDRARAIQRNRFTDPYVIAAGTDRVSAIQSLLSNRAPATTFSFPASGTITSTTPLVIITGQDDPWKVAVDLAAAAGYELFFDALGVAVLRVEPDPTTAIPVWTYAEGATATILSAERDLDDALGYNVAVYVGESVAGPVRGIARDSNPSSPTYYLGPYGSVPVFETSQFATDQPAADAAAAGLLRRKIGITEGVAFDAVPNPAHEPGDVVAIKRTTSNIDQVNVLDTIRMGLGATIVMSAATRARKVTS